MSSGVEIRPPVAGVTVGSAGVGSVGVGSAGVALPEAEKDLVRAYYAALDAAPVVLLDPVDLVLSTLEALRLRPSDLTLELTAPGVSPQP